MQRFRADTAQTQPDGAVRWYSKWIGGPTLAKINKCRVDGTDLRLAVYVTGDVDTWFSTPAATRYRGKYIAGYITGESDAGDNLVFHAMDRHKPRLNTVKG
jgi:hypothetical protein